MKVTTRTETSVFIESLNQSEINAALTAAGLSETDNFELRPATVDVFEGSDPNDAPIPKNGYELVYCSETVEYTA